MHSLYTLTSGSSNNPPNEKEDEETWMPFRPTVSFSALVAQELKSQIERRSHLFF
jgi:hypothetical protein